MPHVSARKRGPDVSDRHDRQDSPTIVEATGKTDSMRLLRLSTIATPAQIDRACFVVLRTTRPGLSFRFSFLWDSHDTTPLLGSAGSTPAEETNVSVILLIRHPGLNSL